MEYPTEQTHPSIELKIISCKDLRAFNFFQKLTIYALVSIATQDPNRHLNQDHKQQQRTKTDRDSDDDDGGTNPEWYHDALFDLRWVKPSLLQGSQDLFLKFEFRHDGVLLGDKLIGECRVPIADLVSDDGAADVARFVSYEVRSGEGKPNGIFNFSYKLNGIRVGIGNWNNNNSNNHDSSQILEGRISGYPVVDPEDCNPNQLLVQYPSSRVEIGSACCYSTVETVYSTPSAVVPPPVPSFGECSYCYPPPPMQLPPPPPPYAYPPPPPPPPPSVFPAAEAQGAMYYPPFGPDAQPWPSEPSFGHRW